MSAFRAVSTGIKQAASVAASLNGGMKRHASSASRQALSLDGIFIPLTTPFCKDEDIAWEQLTDNLNKYEKIPFAGYVVAGSNGEAPYLSPDERIALVKTVRKNTKRIVIGGATAESTKATCYLAEEMKIAGADALLVMPPFYFRKRMTEEAVSEHYLTVADKCGLPIVIYNMPMVTGIDISTSALAKLARHPLIRGVKDTDVRIVGYNPRKKQIRKCAGTVQQTKDLNFDVLIGSAGYLLGSLFSGCSGGVNGLAGIMGKELCSIHQMYKQGRIAEASDLQKRIFLPDTLFLSELGVPGLKAAMDLLGYAGGACRKPLLPVSPQDMDRVRQCLTSAGLL